MLGVRHPYFSMRADNENHRVLIRLVGVKSNKAAIGARVIVTTAAMTQTDEVRAGSSYLSTSDSRLHFGLGNDAVMKKIEVRWPSGLVQEFHDVKADAIYEVKEGDVIRKIILAAITSEPNAVTGKSGILFAKVATGLSLCFLGLARFASAHQASEPIVTLQTSDARIEVTATTRAPRLISLRGVAGVALRNVQQEALPASVYVDGNLAPVRWQLNPELSSKTEQHVEFVYECAELRLRLRWQWDARAEVWSI